MNSRDPFESTPSQPGAWQPDEPRSGHPWEVGDGSHGAAPSAGDPGTGYAAPGYSPPTAPGFASGQPAMGQPVGAQPASGPPAYGYSGQAPSPSSSSGTDGTSIAALVTGLLGLGVVATVLGAIGLRRTADGRRKGTGMAWAGVILGLIGTIVWSGAIAWGIAGASTFWDEVGNEFNSDAAYGEDPFLDGLWDQCEAGDMAACDDLYYESPVGSEYEDFGWECGGQGRGLLDYDCASQE